MVWGLADILKKLFNLPMSSGIVGLFLMLGLLLTGVIKLDWVNVGAKFILGELVLLFIPLMMSITQYQQLFFARGWQLMITIVVSTALVMLSSAITFMLGNRVKRAWYRRTHHTHQ
nr:CidA/LrgA family protein [Moraxella osloensis]